MVRVLIVCVLGLLAAVHATPANHEHLALWKQFKHAHGKTYKTAAEETARFNIFVENHQKIQEHNAAGHAYSLAMNKYGDMTNQEFRTVMNGYKTRTTPKTVTNLYQPVVGDIPASVDWRTKGYVTGVKDQGQCGSCWAFSATGSLEGQHFKKNGQLVSLSEQNLVDCSQAEGNDGCGGGWMDQAFAYIKQNNGVDTEASYPYQAVDGKCRFQAPNVGATDTGDSDIKTGDESGLENAIANVGPISVAIDASQFTFQFYSKGVYNEPKCQSALQDLDHGVLAVGYDTTSDGQKYYIVKNSWGQDWGQQGYIWMSREKNNQCGIATAASYPTV